MATMIRVGYTEKDDNKHVFKVVAHRGAKAEHINEVWFKPTYITAEGVESNIDVNEDLLAATLSSPWATLCQEVWNETPDKALLTFAEDLWEADRASVRGLRELAKNPRSEKVFNINLKTPIDETYDNPSGSIEGILVLFSGGKESLLTYLLANQYCLDHDIPLCLGILQDVNRANIMEAWGDLIQNHNRIIIETNFCSYMDDMKDRVTGPYNLFYDTMIGAFLEFVNDHDYNLVLVGNEAGCTPPPEYAVATNYGACFNQSVQFCKLYTRFARDYFKNDTIQIRSWLDQIDQLQIQYYVWSLNPFLASRQTSCMTPINNGMDDCLECPKCLRTTLMKYALGIPILRGGVKVRFEIVENAVVKALQMNVRDHDPQEDEALWELIRSMASIRWEQERAKVVLQMKGAKNFPNFIERRIEDGLVVPPPFRIQDQYLSYPQSELSKYVDRITGRSGKDK